MRPPSLCGFLAPALTLSLTVATLSRAADELPVVNVVPFASTRAGTGENSLLSSQLPASREFFLRQPLPPDADEVSAELLIWPAAESREGCAQPPEGRARQFYALGMVVKGDANARYLEAKVPALQVGQTFCFKINPRQALSQEQLRAASETATTALLTRLKGQVSRHEGSACADLATLPVFKQALAEALGQQALRTEDITPAVQLALNHYIVSEKDECDRLAIALLRMPSVDQLAAAESNVNQAEARLQNLPMNLPPLRAPLVVTGQGQVVPASELLTASTNEKDLQDAANQLRARQTSDPAWQAVLGPWAQALETLAQAAPEKRKETAASLQQQVQSGQLPSPPTFELWDGTSFVSPAAFVKGPHTADAVRAALSTVGRLPASPERQQWTDALNSLLRARQNADEARTAYRTRQDDFTRAETALRTLILGAFEAEDVRKQLRVHVPPVQMSPTAGSGVTPAKANYASLDLGAVFAFPRGDTWFLPYVGLNVYFVPVDRTIAPSQLTGSFVHRLIWQRLSVTLGMSLSAPTTSGRTIEAPFLERYPLGALGYRVGSYSRVVGGVLFYKEKDPNSLSERRDLKAAPFAGASLDIDLVHLLTPSP